MLPSRRIIVYCLMDRIKMSRDDIDCTIAHKQLLAAKIKAAGNVVNTWGMLATEPLPTFATNELEATARVALAFLKAELTIPSL